MKRTLFASASLFVLVLAHASSAAVAQTAELPSITLTSPVAGLSQPVGITHANDGSGRLFVIEQPGRIRIIRNGALVAAPFLDINPRVIDGGGERGLLGLAFPPDYASKGYFYVNYINTAGNTNVSRFRRSADNPDAADPASEQVVVTVEQPAFTNHKGGQLAFGPRDRQLYVGTGDGGSGNDPNNFAQNPLVLLGKMLRLDTETGRPFRYTVPADNPFAGRADVRPEIWATGLRNPWRFSFDRAAHDLYIADVGQGAREEVNFQHASGAGGENYGWRVFEGMNCTGLGPAACAPSTPYTFPVFDYGHGSGDCSVTGGYVYRGPSFARMRGLYIYGDFCSGRIWALRRDSGGAWLNTLLLDTSIQISTFGEDEAGNLYVAGYGTGTIFRVEDTGAMPPPPPTPEPARVEFGAFTASVTVNEDARSASFVVDRLGDPSAEFTVDYATAGGTADERGDYTTARGTLRFAPGVISIAFNVLVTDDARDEPNETLTLTLQNLRGPATLGAQSTATLTINDNDPPTTAANPIDDSAFFVRQHYHDFLNREPDAAGLQFWVSGIESCGADQSCREVKRIDTSAAFFLSIEFQETGFLVYLLHKAAFGQMPRYNDFVSDTQAVGRGVVVGQGNWQQQLEANKRALVNEFVTRPAFVARFPTEQTPNLFIDTLNAPNGFPLDPAERDAVLSGLNNGTQTRATALRRVAEDFHFRRQETNPAFVLMQYFGYLRRDADAPDFRGVPDPNFEGFNFWLSKLNSFNGNYVEAEMVKAFISSIEYRQRFGQ